MEMKEMKIDDLTPAYYNPRKELGPEDAEYIKLKRSIENFGYVDPVIYNQQTGTVVGGHQRLKVLKDLGYESIMVSVIDVSEEQEKALNLALNKIDGEWDNALLKDLLEELDTGDFNMDLTGFDFEEIEDLMTQFHMEDEEGIEGEDDEFDPEEALEDIEDPVAKRGDIWQLGNHRLMCGDSTNENDVSVLMDGEEADIAFTDPPWNVNYGDVKEGNSQGYKPRKIKNDHMSTEDFKSFLDLSFEQMNKSLKPGAMVYVVMSAQEWGNAMQSLFEQDFHWSSTIIWKKDRLVLSRKDYHTQYEPIWYGWKNGSPRLCPLEDRKQSDVWDFERPMRSEEHPTMKPIPLVVKAIQNSSRKGDKVIDPFGGSGSTLIASEQTGRTCYMMELDERYCDVIIKRWEEFTGEKAVKLNEE